MTAPIMSPLAMLERQGVRVSIHEALDLRMVFRRHGEAEAYLRTWQLDPGAMASLRRILRRCERGAPVGNMTDDQVIVAVARHIVSGNLVLTESAPPVPVATSFPVIPPATNAAAAAAIAAAVPAALAKKPVLPILPLLEETQIEGAKVLPEVLQTLAQLEDTMSKINLATVSLEPAPSGVPNITTTLTDATDQITTTLDEL